MSPKKKKQSVSEKIFQRFKNCFAFRWNIANGFSSFLVGFLVGTALITGTEIAYHQLISLAVLSLLLFVGIILYFSSSSHFKIYFLFFFLLGASLAIWRAEKFYQNSQGWLSGQYQGVAELSGLPEEQSHFRRVYFQIIGLQEKRGRLQKEKERILTFLPQRQNLRFGEKYFLQCQLENPSSNFFGFNYQKYLAGKKVYQICRHSKVKTMPKQTISFKRKTLQFYWQKSKNRLLNLIYRFNQILAKKIDTLFPPPQNAYLAGLLLGGSNRLPADLLDDFKRTGTIHTVAVSGFNITIIAGAVMWLLIALGFWRKQAFWFAVLALFLFIAMIGFPPSGVRAGIMGIILLYALQEGELVSSLRVILFTGALMVFFSPFILLYDVGFQLSFLATMGIILLYDPLQKYLQKISGLKKDFLQLLSGISITLSAQLGVLGILLYTFHSFSFISILANLLILPAIPLIMLGGVLTIFISTLDSFLHLNNILSLLFALPTDWLLQMEIFIIHKLAQIPGAFWQFSHFPLRLLIGYYSSLGLITAFIHCRRLHNRRRDESQ